MVEDADLRAAGLHRPLRAQLEAATPAELQAALEADLQERFWASDDLVYVVAGHAQDGLVWRPDSMVQVRDEVLGLDEPRYLVGRRFTMSKREGQRTELRLRRPGVWLP
jgi:prophage tail gpP-like protein